MAADPLARTLIDRETRLRADRAPYESKWRQIREFIRPAMSSFAGTGSPGPAPRDSILDSSGETSAEVLAATMHGELTNPADRWFQLEAEDTRLNRDGEVAAWLENTEARQYRLLGAPSSRWDSALKPWYGEVADFGLAIVANLSLPGVGVRFRHYPVDECCIDQNADGEVDTVTRRFRLSARAAVAEWGEACGPEVVKAAADDKLAGEEFEFLRVVAPLPRADAVGRRWASTFVGVRDAVVVAEGRFFEFPFMVGRWAANGSSAYPSTCPGMRALADVKMLQRMMEVTIAAGELAVWPPMLAPDDGVVGPISLESRAINYYRADLLYGGRDPLRPMVSGVRPDIGEELMAKTRERIDNAYYAHLLRTPRDPRMLQDQILDIAAERARVMGPIFAGIQSEAIGPAIDRVLQVMIRAGATLKPPAKLAGKSVRVSFENPFAQARAASETRAISRFIAMQMPLLQLDEEVKDNLDLDEMQRVGGAGLNVPMTIFRDPDAVKQIRKNRAEERARQAEIEMQATQAKAMQSASQAVASQRGSGQ